jgi:hypothetical protein
VTLVFVLAHEIRLRQDRGESWHPRAPGPAAPPRPISRASLGCVGSESIRRPRSVIRPPSKAPSIDNRCSADATVASGGGLVPRNFRTSA